MSGGIPAIDIAPFLDGSDKPSVARRVAEACERIGFVIVSGHGIEPAVIDRAFERSWAFFDRPRAEKDRWHPQGPSRQRGFHGFATRGLAYTLGEETPPDLQAQGWPHLACPQGHTGRARTEENLSRARNRSRSRRHQENDRLIPDRAKKPECSALRGIIAP